MRSSAKDAASSASSQAIPGAATSSSTRTSVRPWCRVLMGDADEWCSPMQVQGHCQAIRLTGGAVTMRLFPGAHHSFDRGTKIVDIADASVSPAAPTTYLADDGAFIHPLEAAPNPTLTDRDVMVYSLKAGYGRKGAKLGSRDGEATLFRNDMVAFWKRVLGG